MSSPFGKAFVILWLKRGRSGYVMLSLGEHLLRGRNYVLSVGSLKERENIGVGPAIKMSWYDVSTS